jgi:hypothetical protein
MAGKKGKSHPSISPSVRPTAAAKAILRMRLTGFFGLYLHGGCIS